MGNHYGWWMLLPHADFARIVDPNDQVFMLLATHCTSTICFLTQSEKDGAASFSSIA